MVPPQQNAAPMRAALESSPSDHVSVRVLEGLNHLMQPAKADQAGNAAEIDTTLSPEILEQLTGWIQERAGFKK
jgi:hypothetical protein